MLTPLFSPKRKMRVAGFMSGTGSNLRTILENQKESNYEIVMIYSNAAAEKTCKGRQISEEYGIPYYCRDIKEYYKEKECSDLRDMSIRAEYDEKTVSILEKNSIDAVALCGYLSVVTKAIYDKFLTVNIHPADLRILDSEGNRRYAGCMKEKCVEKAAHDKRDEFRSTIHLVNDEVDGGIILTVSEPVDMSPEGVLKTFENLNKKGCAAYAETLKKLSRGHYWVDKEEQVSIDLVEEKQLIRDRMNDIRNSMSPDEVKTKSLQVEKNLLKMKEFSDAENVAFYLPIKNEVDVLETILKTLDSGKGAFVPVLRNGELIPSRLKSMDSLKKGTFGILEPEDPELVNPETLDLVVVPGVAFDREGNRLGRGRGFYDRFLKKTRAFKIGVAYETQILDKIRKSHEDVKMDKVVTDRNV